MSKAGWFPLLSQPGVLRARRLPSGPFCGGHKVLAGARRAVYIRFAFVSAGARRPARRPAGFTAGNQERDMAEVVLEGVSKVFPGGVQAVRNMDLAIRDEEFIVLVGPSGCGKSTTLRMVAGLEEITSGTVRIGERVVNDVPPKDRDIAMVFQNYALYPHMTVYRNMAFALKLRKFAGREIDRRVRHAAEVLGIEELLDRKPKALSGGQRQRVAVGRAIVRQPAAFLFDEPLSNLDAKLRVEMRAELKRLHRRLQTTTIYVTHDQEEAMTLGDRIVVMKDGQVQQCGPPLEVYDRPANRFVAGFVGTPPMNFFEGRLAGKDGGVYFDEGTASLLLPDELSGALASAGRADGEAVLGVRPEALGLSGDGRFVAFSSGASNLVENDKGGWWDIFVYDLQTRSIRVGSLWPDGTDMHFHCIDPSISSDGRYVAFQAFYGTHVFVRDMEARTTDVIARDCGGDVGLVRLHWLPTLRISDDGRFVVFACLSNKPMPDLRPAWGYIYLFDRETREMTMVAPLDKPPEKSSPPYDILPSGGYHVLMSGDGRYVFYNEWEGNRKELHLYRYDRVTNRRDEVVYASNLGMVFAVIPREIQQVAAVNRHGSILAFETQSGEFYPFVDETPRVDEDFFFRLFRVELWDTPSGVSRWPYHR